MFGVQAFKVASHESYLQGLLRYCTARGVLVFTAIYTVGALFLLLHARRAVQRNSAPGSKRDGVKPDPPWCRRDAAVHCDA